MKETLTLPVRSGLPPVRAAVAVVFFLNPSCSLLFGFVLLRKKLDHCVLPLNRRINPSTNAIIKGSLGLGLTTATNPTTRTTKKNNCLFDRAIDLAV